MRGLQILASHLVASLESSSCKDEEMSVQVVGRNRAEMGEWGKTGLVLERECGGGLGGCSTGERGKERGRCKEMLKNKWY